MARRITQALLCLFLLSLVIYFYIYHGRPPNRHRVNLDHTATNEIPAIVVFENGKNHVTTGNCSSSFSFAYVTVDPNQKWQKVANKSGWYLYSAYVDKRQKKETLRILSMWKGGVPSPRLFCRVWYTANQSSLEEIQKHELWIHAWDMAEPGMYHQPFLLSCPTAENPVAVSVVSKPCENPSNSLNVTSPGTGRNSSEDFVVCLKPLNFQEDISLRLIEWLELQFLLGADRVFVYVYHIHPTTWKVLKHYEKAGKLGIQIHSLPSAEGGLWQKRRHEMVVYNDCFYRHVHSHRFVVNLDLDEAIIPLNHTLWKDTLEAASMDSPQLRLSASISVPNVYFFDSFGETPDRSVPPYMHMLRHVFRSANFTPPGFAQKSFFSTNYTLVVSNHYTLRALRPQVRLMSSVGSQFAHLHHYRKTCPPTMEEDCAKNYLRFRSEDKALWKFKKQLVKNVDERVQEIGFRSLNEKRTERKSTNFTLKDVFHTGIKPRTVVSEVR